MTNETASRVKSILETVQEIQDTGVVDHRGAVALAIADRILVALEDIARRLELR